MQFNFIDLFSGAGGLSSGLERIGMKCILGVDNNKSAMETFSLNHKSAYSFCGDIHDLKGKMLKDIINKRVVHLIVGGPPCQGFSTVGRGDPNDRRNKLFLEFYRIVKEIRPYYLIIENVTGLLAKKNYHILKSIMSKFNSLGYVINVQVMASEEYGVPERRRRTIFLGSRLNVDVFFPKPTHSQIPQNSQKKIVTVGEALRIFNKKNIEFQNHDLKSAQLRSELDIERLKKVPEGKHIRYEDDEKRYLTPNLYLGVDWKKLRENRFRQGKFHRLDRKLPAPTILTDRYLYYHPKEHRHLTAREAATIQSFSLDFVFKGSITSQWKQIGNAVPPLLGSSLGKQVLKMYKEYNKKRKDKVIRNINKKINIEQKIECERVSAFKY